MRLAYPNRLGLYFASAASIFLRRPLLPDTLLYLVSLGVIAITIVVVFFGLGFLLLAHPNEQHIAGAGLHDSDIEVEPQPSDPLRRRTRIPHPSAYTRNQQFADSLLEGDGFELVVPRHDSP